MDCVPGSTTENKLEDMRLNLLNRQETHREYMPRREQHALILSREKIRLKPLSRVTEYPVLKVSDVSITLVGGRRGPRKPHRTKLLTMSKQPTP
jgi:hypothetical protein